MCIFFIFKLNYKKKVGAGEGGNIEGKDLCFVNVLYSMFAVYSSERLFVVKQRPLDTRAKENYREKRERREREGEREKEM